MKSISAIADWNTTTQEQTSSPQYEAVLQLSESLWTYRHQDELLTALAHQLPLVTRAAFLGLALYDQDTDRLQTYGLEAERNRSWAPAVPGQESLCRWVVEQQAAIVIPSVP